MAKVTFHGQMDENILVNSKMVSKMAKEFSGTKKESKWKALG